MDEEPAELHVTDFSNVPGTDEYREGLERARAEARRRYHDHLTTVLDLHGAPTAAVLADVALDALTVWCYVDSGERCRCACHPRLPETDLHDYGFACPCARTREDRRRAWQEWRNDIKAFWESPQGQRIRSEEKAAEANLQAWLAVQQGVIVSSHGGLAPEQWDGEVDGHSFYFRERHGEWRIELDLRPSGRLLRTLAGTNSDGTPQYGQKELTRATSSPTAPSMTTATAPHPLSAHSSSSTPSEPTWPAKYARCITTTCHRSRDCSAPPSTGVRPAGPA
ncbi:hypothetical protein [Mycobacterium intracellulare]|uniref:Uncharacterized protein n=1 Tax=Mycobacterium intracellulare subsp. chimaera TaxID=222805 RepID=A0ABT7NVH1_MYCIT|nr:hypothetical protein [Mycobacterium intracellulare]MCF1815014.1 hypothetical protein [Mycobacterium intracellulare subsp. intracellulare]MDM3924980.1 hypothetical protein [Mycobacterium intracellulare subsp. chimaera]MDS0335264.1 hypothetical protein [Mycobacterium intracellulare]